MIITSVNWQSNTAIGQIAEPTKLEIKEGLIQHKPALPLEETFLLIKDLADKTTHRTTYTWYIDSLNNFDISQNDDDIEKQDEAFNIKF